MTLLYADHIVYIYVIGILAYNLVIAIFSDTVRDVYERRQAMLASGQLWTTEELFMTLTRTPLIGSIAKKIYTRRIPSYFVYENQRTYLVLRKSAIKKTQDNNFGLCIKCLEILKRSAENKRHQVDGRLCRKCVNNIIYD